MISASNAPAFIDKKSSKAFSLDSILSDSWTCLVQSFSTNASSMGLLDGLSLEKSIDLISQVEGDLWL